MSYPSILVSAGLATVLCAVMGHLFLNCCKIHDYNKAFWYKGAAGLGFVAVGLLISGLCSRPEFAALVVWGLIFGLAGDQLLALRFIRTHQHDLMFGLGAGAFALGHVLYVAALFRLHQNILPVALPIWGLGMIVTALYAKIRNSHAGRLQLGGMVYMALVMFMSAAALSAAAATMSMGLLMFAAGGLSFVISDNILCSYCFGNKKTFGMNRAIHISYYAAQLLIAWSMLAI